MSWNIIEGKTKTVYDPESGEPSEVVVAPWVAEYLHGGAVLHADSEEILKAQIKAHPYENGRSPVAAKLEN